jgi:hypothetical protein
MTDDLTPEEIDALFRATQPIGDRIRVIAEAELIVEAAAGIPPHVRARLDETLRDLTDGKDTP